MAHDRASERATFPPSELVRLELIDRRRAAAILAGTPEPDLPWERGFPPDILLDALRKIVAAEAAGTSLGPFFAYVIVRQEPRCDRVPRRRKRSSSSPPWEDWP